MEFCIFIDRLLVSKLWMCGSPRVFLGLFGACAMAVGCYFVIFGCLCPGCGQVVYLSFSRGVGLVFG